MTHEGPSGRDLSMMLADDIEAVVEALGLDVVERSRRTLYCYAPWNNHARPKLEIEVYPRGGKWNDWIEGRYGDAISLVACVLSGRCEPKDTRALAAAFQWAKAYLGIAGTYDQAAFERRREAAQQRAKAAAAKAARELSDQRRTAKGLWLAAQPMEPGTAGWDYLLARGIDLAQLPTRPRAVRFSPRQPYIDTKTGEEVHVGPALMSAMTLPNNEFGSVHRIWIDPDQPGEKADLDPPRKMWPASEGAVIRLWRGSTGLSEKDANAQGVIEDVVVCEGVEDGLSIALMTPEMRVVAAGSLPGLLSYVPPKLARRIVVAADNDWGKPQAQALLNRACERLFTDFNRPISLARSPAGKDFNDLLRGK